MRHGWARRVPTAVQDGISHLIFGDLFLARHPDLSRAETRGHRHRAGVPALGQADLAAGAGDDRERLRGLSRHRRPEQAAGGIRRPQIRSRNCWPIFPTASIPAARTANFIPVWWPGRSSPTASVVHRRARRARRLCVLRSSDEALTPDHRYMRYWCMKQIAFTAASSRQWIKLSPDGRRRIDRKLIEFATTGHGDVKRLEGQTGIRLRVGDWRVIFYEDQGTDHCCGGRASARNI